MSEPSANAVKPLKTAAKPPPWLSKKVIVYAVLALVALVIAFFVLRWRSEPTTGKLILGKVVVGDLIETVTATGSVNAQTGAEVHIGSQISGRIKKLNADIGTQLKAGDVIAELDMPDLLAQLDESKAALAQAKLKYDQEISGTGLTYTTTASGISQAQAAADSAKQKLQVAQSNLQQQAVTTPADIQKATNALAVANSALVVANATVKSVTSTANLSVVNATEQLAQDQANADSSAVNDKRLYTLWSEGFAARLDYDTAHALYLVNASQVRAAERGLTLTKEKAQLDIQTAQAQLDQATQNLQAARASLDSAKAEQNLVTARQADVQDAQATIRQSAAAQRLANAGRANDTIKAQNVRIAADAVKQATDAMANSQAQYDKALIKSPIAGTVLQLAAQQGETLSAGLSTQTLIVVADLSRLQVDAYVDETDIAKVALGQVVHITVSAMSKKVFDGVVQKIASGSTIQQGVVTYDVTVALTKPGHTLKPDMTANVTIETAKRTNVLLIPAVAVITGTKGSTVNVMKDGKVSSVKVVTGGTDGANVEIVSGLKAGDQIVLAGTVQGQAATGTSAFSSGGGGGGGGRGGGRGG